MAMIDEFLAPAGEEREGEGASVLARHVLKEGEADE